LASLSFPAHRTHKILEIGVLDPSSLRMAMFSVGHAEFSVSARRVTPLPGQANFPPVPVASGKKLLSQDRQLSDRDWLISGTSKEGPGKI
jgi:hypothetical protein